jgi:tetratricopeptide (TPR) repeat protein
VPGARFCTQCGAAARSSIGGNTGWYVAAGVLVVMIGLVWILTARDRAPGMNALNGAAAVAPFADGATGDASPPPLTGTPREQADRLFNRIMAERESGDTAQARFLLPMGIQAYQQAGELEPDGLYHLALLQESAGQGREAIATAERILATNPDHLLALGAAAEAAEELGDRAAATRYYEHNLEAYPTEKTRTTAEYIDHSKLLPLYEQAARRYLGK